MYTKERKRGDRRENSNDRAEREREGRKRREEKGKKKEKKEKMTEKKEERKKIIFLQFYQKYHIFQIFHKNPIKNLIS